VIAWLMLSVAALIPFALLDALHLTLVALAWLVAAICLVVKVHPTLSRWMLETATLEQADIEASYQPPHVDPSRLAILCSRRDEVRHWLHTWDVLGRAPFVVGCVLLPVVGLAARVNLPAFVDALAAKVFHRGLDDVRVLGLDGWALIVGSLVLCVIWSAVLLGSGIVRWPAYFREPLLLNLFVEIGIDRVPAGSHVARTFDVPAPRKRNQPVRRWLRHGAICADRDVARAIGNWIVVRALEPS
jgi:hypothetical protein